MPIGFKHRRWEVFVSVSASGPEFSKVFERSGYLLRTRMAADLDSTTADVDYLYDHFTEPEPDRPRSVPVGSIPAPGWPGSAGERTGGTTTDRRIFMLFTPSTKR